jgi:uncharacterized repeat protein (TIGR03943 family)
MGAAVSADAVTPRPGLVGPTLLLAVAAVVVRLVVTGEYTNFVKPAMAPFLLLSAGFLTFLAIADLLPRRASPNHTDPHSHLPGVAWLLLAPVLVVIFAAPTGLGSYTAAQSAGSAPVPAPAAGGYLPLPAGDPLALPLVEYAERSAYGGGPTLENRRFSLMGFVSPGPTSDTWYVTRLTMQCCASDATPVKVLAVGAPPRANDDWVVVTGSYLPVGSDQIARLQVSGIEDTEAPEYPYVFR